MLSLDVIAVSIFQPAAKQSQTPIRHDQPKWSLVFTAIPMCGKKRKNLIWAKNTFQYNPIKLQITQDK
jgi:hypothetical protein